MLACGPLVTRTYLQSGLKLPKSSPLSATASRTHPRRPARSATSSEPPRNVSLSEQGLCLPLVHVHRPGSCLLWKDTLKCQLTPNAPNVPRVGTKKSKKPKQNSLWKEGIPDGSS